MAKENLSLPKRLGKNKFLLFWMVTHIFLWGLTQAMSATAKLSLHLFVAQLLNPFICSLEISTNTWGSTCTILGIDVGLAIGQFVSLLVAALLGGVMAGLAEWWLLKKIFSASATQRTPIIVIPIIIGLSTAFLVNFFAMFSDIVNVLIDGVNSSLATFAVGGFFGGFFGFFYGIVTLVIYYLTINKKLMDAK